MLIYLDNMILIYAFDHTGSYKVRADQRLDALDQARDRIAVGDLTRFECRMHPIRRQALLALQDCDGFFARSDVTRVALTTSVYDRATIIRARHSFKAMDSLHLAAAVEGECDVSLTNDTRLGRFPDIPIEVLP